VLTRARSRRNSLAAAPEVVERRLAALTEIAQTMVSGLDYERILAAVIEKVATLLDAASGGFMLYENSTRELVLQKPAFGLQTDELISRYRVPLSAGGNAASVFVTGQPYVSNSAKTDPKLLRPFADIYNAERVLTVPLKIEGRSIGVYHAINKRSGDFTTEDVGLLSLLAPHLAVVIQAASMMRELQARELQIERVIERHNALVSMVLSRSSFEELLVRLSELLALPVAAMELNGVTYTGMVMDRELRTEVDLQLVAAVVAMSAKRGDHLEPQTFPLQDSQLIAVPIAAGSELLGAVAAVIGFEPIDDLLILTLQQAALVFALAIMNEREVNDVERRLQANILERLFVLNHLEDASHLLRRLGIASDVSLRVAHVSIRVGEGSTHGTPAQFLSPRLHRALSNSLARHWRGSVAVERDLGHLAILPSLPGTPIEVEIARLDAVREDLVHQAVAPGTATVLIAVGGAVPGAGHLRRSDEQAQIVASVARALDPCPPVVFYEQLGVYRLLAQPMDSSDVNEYVRHVLGPVLEHDAAQHSDWLRFLSVLADANFSAKNAARQLNIHHNTAKYRAGRISDLLGRRLDSASNRLEIQVALEILRTRALLSHEAWGGGPLTGPRLGNT
jgi:GAF domain-containing protein